MNFFEKAALRFSAKNHIYPKREKTKSFIASLKNLQEKIKMKKPTSLALLLSIAILIFQPSLVKAQTQRETVINTATVKLPLSGAVFTETKMFDLKTGSIVGSALDSKNSRVDAQKLIAEENRLFIEKYGKLTPEVYDAVQKRAGSDMISVGILLRIRDLPDGKDLKKGNFEMSEREVTAISERRNQQVDAAVQKAAAPLIEQLARLKRLPKDFDKRRSVSPIISATVTVDELRELVKRDDVAQVYLEERKPEPFLNSSAKTLNVPAVWANGITGSGVRVAVVEGGRVNFANPFIPSVNGIPSANAGNTLFPTGPLDNHATKVAGIIAAQPFTISGLNHKGIAYGAKIYSANTQIYYDISQLHMAIDAGANNAHISNNSWGYTQPSGAMDSFGVHADWIVRAKWDGIVSAIGNSGLSTNFNKPSATGIGYNTIAVGSFNDQKTGFNFLDDVMSGFSTSGNPNSVHNDREKPEVSAPGEDIATTFDSQLPVPTAPWFTANAGDGTSFASPMVAGIHALIQQAKPALTIYPETTKAIILAGSVRNIEGNPAMSSKDGAGGVDTEITYESVVNNRYDWRTLTPNSFPNPGPSPYYEINIGNIPAGNRVKVALHWLSNPSSNYNSLVDPLGIDLDMSILDSNGNFVTGSGSWDDNKEVAQFYSNGGSYKVRIYKYSWNAAQNPWTWTAVAWSVS